MQRFAHTSARALLGDAFAEWLRPIAARKRERGATAEVKAQVRRAAFSLVTENRLGAPFSSILVCHRSTPSLRQKVGTPKAPENGRKACPTTTM